MSSDLTFADHVPGNASGSDGYGDPHGPFLTDLDMDGNDDSIAGRALSLASPFSPAAGYTGQPIYGGGSVTREDSLVNDGFSEVSILNQGPNDSIHYHVDTGGTTHTFHLAMYWDKADFLHGSSPTIQVPFDPAGSFELSTAQSSGHHTDELLHWMIREGTQFYISEATIALSNNSDYTASFASLDNWAPYNPIDPLGAPVAADLWSLDFDENSSFNVDSSTFEDITAFGFYVEHEAATGPVHVHIEGFQASSIPEPSAATLCALCIGLPLLLTRRRRVRP